MLGTPESLARFPLPIVGRRREIAEIERLVEETRLLTIAGPGGIGKTRLAIELAQRCAERGDGGAFVPLAGIADGDLVASAVATAIGLDIPSHAEAAGSLVAALSDHRSTIVLDNCEHVLASVARLAGQIVSACPEVRLVTTSRESLGIVQEYVYRLDALDEIAAVEFFAAQARRADPLFQLNLRNRASVERICERLDRIALAIELAAARLRSTPVEALVDLLDERFNVLLGAWTADVPHHRTMQACLDWSYELLDERERAIFRRLGTLCGGFTADAAVAVSAAGDVEPRDVARELGALADKSLLAPSGDGTHRYRMLETIREYAALKLAHEGDELPARRAHATYFATRSAQAAASCGYEPEEAWTSRYAPDLDNFRAALDWAVDADVELAARITANLANFWEPTIAVAEGLRRSEAVLTRYENRVGKPDARLLTTVAGCAFSVRDYRRSLELAGRALSIAATAEDCATANRITGASRCLLGIEPARSVAELRAALEYFCSQDNPLNATRALADYAYALAQQDPAEGRRLLLDALSAAAPWPRMAVRIEIRLAELEFRSANVAQAIAHAQSVVESLRAARAPLALAHALVNLSSYLCTEGETSAAFRVAREAAAIARAHEIPQWVAIAVQNMAYAHASGGAQSLGARLLGYVDEFYDAAAMTREPTEEIVCVKLRGLLSRSLDPATLKRELEAGRAMSEGDAYAAAVAPKV